LVTKVHHEVKVRAGKGYTIVYVGHQGHEEAVGTVAVAPQAVRLVESEEDVGDLPDPGTPVALLAQTTLSHDEWTGIMERARDRFPDLWMPGRSDLCFATTNRQAALKAIASRSDAVVVLGSANSSNTRALEKVARSAGCRRVYRVNSADELPDDLDGTVGVTAGASAPEELVEAVVARLAPQRGTEAVDVTIEDEYFPPPRELRDLLRAVAMAVGCSVTAPPETPAGLSDDRAMAASEALAALAD
jgi:4-hydroxy-3-methylbut-2-enyl diphosphate reductase